MQQSLVRSLVLAACASLSACGGGGSSGPGSGSLALSGVAATGVALAGATVTVKCATGTGSTTTAADGAYALTLTEAALPCALEVVGGGTTLHSLQPGTGRSGNFTVNLSPLTELVVAAAAGTAPAAFFGSFSDGSAPSAAAVTAAIAAVKTMAAGVVDLTGVNPLSDPLEAAGGGRPGNDLDKKIDALMAAIAAARTSLDAIAAAVVANPGSTDTVATVLQPVSSACAWLRSGRYRMINGAETDPQWRAHVLELDAGTLTATLWDGTTATLVDAGGCKFSVDESDRTTTVMVAASGVLIVHSQSKSLPDDRSVTVGLPEQVQPLSGFAGTWNFADWYSQAGASNDFVAQTGLVTIDGSGNITDLANCFGADCEPGTTPFPRLATNPAGGFDLVDDGTVAARAFLFKTLAGQAMFVVLSDEGEILVGTRQQSVGAVPAVDSVSNYREFGLLGNGTITPLADDSNVVTAADAAARTVTRRRSSDRRVDTLAYDQPRLGLRNRQQGGCMRDGAPLNCAATVQLPLPGMGITLSTSVTADPAGAFFYVAVGRP